MDKRELDLLLERYYKGECTPREMAAIENVLLNGIKDEGKVTDEEMEELMRTWTELQQPVERTATRTLVMRALPYAAAIVLICSAILLVIRNSSDQKRDNTLANITTLTDVAPGGNRATLTLGDGTSVDLEASQNGQVAAQGYSTVSKSSPGQIVYSKNPQFAGQPNGSNTITTPKGGEYAVELPDGSKVWLNAASSITFPTDMGHGGGAREISMTGEVYFEVAKDESRPFRVKSGTQMVEVLGTHFSINSYADEPQVKTSLLEGSVRITPRSLTSGVLLKPGQQAILNQNSKIKIVPVDESVIAWRKNLIRFRGSDIKSVMRQLSRWYDFETVYTGNISEEQQYNFTVPKDSRLATVLAFISEGTGVAFTIQQTEAGKRIIVKGN